MGDTIYQGLTILVFSPLAIHRLALLLALLLQSVSFSLESAWERNQVVAQVLQMSILVTHLGLNHPGS